MGGRSRTSDAASTTWVLPTKCRAIDHRHEHIRVLDRKWFGSVHGPMGKGVNRLRCQPLDSILFTTVNRVAELLCFPLDWPKESVPLLKAG
jgi:hypothetical protein